MVNMVAAPLLSALWLLLLGSALAPQHFFFTLVNADGNSQHKVVRLSPITIKKATCMRASVRQKEGHKYPALLLNTITARCVAQATCGMLYFPKNRKSVVERFKSEISAKRIKEEGKIVLSYGGKAKIATALAAATWKTIPRRKRGGGYKTLAYLIRNNVIVGGKNHQHGELHLHPHDDENYIGAEDLIEDMDRSLSMLIPIVGEKILDDQGALDLVLSEVNDICHSFYQTSSMRLTSKLMSLVHDHRTFDEELARNLISQGANPNPRTFDSDTTPLMEAAKNGQLEPVKRLVAIGASKSGSSPPLVDSRGRTALHHACSSDASGVEMIVKVLAASCNGDSKCIDARDDAGRTPLATCINQLGMVYILSRPQHNPYVVAVKSLIKDFDADFNIPNYLGHTPLMLAARRKKAKVVEFLLRYVKPSAKGERQLDLEAKDLQGNTAAHHASEWFSWTVTVATKIAASVDLQEIVELHAFDGVETECKDALTSAIVSKSVSPSGDMQFTDAGSEKVTRALVDCAFLTRISKLLITAGVSLDIVNKRGETPLHVMHPYALAQMRQHLVKGAGRMSAKSKREKSETWRQWRKAMNIVSGMGSLPSTSETWATNTQLRTVSNESTDGVERCDFSVVHASKLTPDQFLKEYLGRNRPVLILDGTLAGSSAVGSSKDNEGNLTSDGKREEADVQGISVQLPIESSWDQARQTWANEAWLRSEAGHEHVISGIIPYPIQFRIPHEHDSLDNFFSNPELGRHGSLDGSPPTEFTVPRPYLFHSIDLERPWDTVLGNEISENLGNFSALSSGEFLFETAQFYHGRRGSGAPMHFHGNAINALLKGSKRWSLLPPGAARYSRKHPVLWSKDPEEEYEGSFICHQPSDSFLFVPRGWSHSVLNTAEETATVGVAVEFVWMGSKEVREEFLSRVQNVSSWVASLGLQKAMAV